MKADFMEIAERSVKLFVGDKHIKTVAKRFKDVALVDFIVDEKHKRCNEKEKFVLEFKLLLHDLKINEPYTYEVVRSLTPVEVRKVVNFYKESWFELVLTKNTRIRVPKKFYSMFPSFRNEETKYIN